MVQMYTCVLLLGFLLCLPITNSQDSIGTRGSPPWIKFQGNLYLFQKDIKNPVSFYDAEDSCRARGGHLASIHSDAENEFFCSMAKQEILRGRKWLGLNILKGNDTPEWTDGTLVNYTKTVPKEFYKNEKCYVFMNNGWRPEDCGLHYYPICKRPAYVTPSTIPPPTTLPEPVGYCPKNWIQFEHKCYRYFGKQEEDRLKFKQARDACWALGKNNDLVSIHSMEEQAFLTQNLYDLGTSAWIGINKIESDEIGHDLVFGWIDNSKMDFTNWAAGHPPPGTWKYCGRLNFEDIPKGEWIADYCEIDKKGYICQRPTDPSLPKPYPKPTKCDPEAVEYRDSCYRYFSRPETHANAEKSCKAIGGHLVSILDGFEQSFLYSLIVPKLKSVWNGLASVQGTQYLRWSDKHPVYYTNWVDGQPKLNKRKQICSILDVSNELKWNITDCSLELPYVCEITDETPPTFPEVLGDCRGEESSSIDIGDEYCYHMGDLNNRLLSWDSNFRYCLSKGMKMIKTYSQHQINSLIAYLWKEHYTINIGLMRKLDEKDSFMWVDRSSLEYQNWDDREPSSSTEDKACVAFSQRTGKWKTISCTNLGIALCQAPKLRKK